MAERSMKARSVSLKQNSIDSTDLVRQAHHRRSKSQQVRFKEDSTSKKQTGLTGLEAKPHKNSSVLAAKAQMSSHRNLSNYAIAFPRSQKSLKNIAIQTSPSLKKHFPVFKKKKINASKSPLLISLDSACSQRVNSKAYEKDNISTDFSHLVVTEDVERNETKKINEATQFLKRRPTAQRNGPKRICLDSNTSVLLEKASTSTQVPDCKHQSSPQESKSSNYVSCMSADLSNLLHSSGLISQSDQNCLPSLDHGKPLLCSYKSSKNNETTVHQDFCKAGKIDLELFVSNEHSGTRESPALSSQLNHSCTDGCHRDQVKPTQSEINSDCATLNNDNQATMPSPKSDASRSKPTCQEEIQHNFVQFEPSRTKNCLDSFQINPSLRKKGIKSQTNKDIKGINQIHLAHGELYDLQGRLQSIEETLQSNQEKIKILLNVIQDLEKARALSEGRSFYRTGQDLNNCSTCQSTACIIYSVEYDFTQQEGKFHQVLNTLDREGESSKTARPQKLEAYSQMCESETKNQKNPKKEKKRCFWWL
uniref:Inhibitory synaptic factor family member 2B n=2 Tax=Latimeria chalumnae TaxID=7897 RepID=H3BE40_LATCH